MAVSSVGLLSLWSVLSAGVMIKVREYRRRRLNNLPYRICPYLVSRVRLLEATLTIYVDLKSVYSSMFKSISVSVYFGLSPFRF